MSYEIVKSISVKNRSITSACNNLRPITYSTSHYKSDDKEGFIKYVLVNALWGNYHLQNSKSLLPFRYALYKYNQLDDELKQDIYNKVWNAYDYKTKTYLYTEEEREEATRKLGDILYRFYKDFKPTKGKYRIKYSTSVWIVSLTKTGFKYTWYKEDAKVYDTLEEVEIIIDYINRNFKDTARIEGVE